MTDKPDFKKDKKANVKYEGYGQLGIIMLDIQFNTMEEGNGLAELAKPMYDKKMWNDDGALIQPPTFRAVADIVLDIVGNVTGHKWIGYLDDALFATLDLTGGYKTPEEVGLELGKKALTSAASYGISSLGSAASAAASAAITNTAANVAAQAGISVAQSYATSVATNAINSVNIKDGKLDFDEEGFGKSLYSKDTIAGALSSGVNVAVTSGAQNFLLKDGNGIELTENVFNTNALNTMAGLTGNAAAALTEYAISGHTTVNLINTSMFGLKNKDLKTGTLSTMHKGLFAVTFDSEEGVSSTISSAGFDMNLGNIATAMNGLHDITKITSAKVSSAFGGKEQISTLNAVNMLGYTNSNLNVSLANDIWQDRLGVEYGDTGDDYGNYTIGDNKIRLSDQLLGGGKEGSAKLAAVMSHEGTHAYGNRIEGYAHLAAADTYSQINQMFKLQADSSFENQIVSALNNPNSWIENTGDVDHWTQVMVNGELGWQEDGDLGFTFLTGDDRYLTPEEMKDLINRYKEGQITKEAYFFRDEYPTWWKDPINEYKDFILNSEGFADASIAAEKLVNGNLTQSNIDDMNAGLYAAQESGLLVKNDYTAVLENGLIGLGTIENPYLPLAGNVQITCLSGYRFVTEDFYNSLKKDSRKNFPLNEFAKNEHIHTDLISDNFNIVTSVDGAIKLNYDDTWGLNGTNYSSGGNVAFLSNHMDPSSIKNYFSLFGMRGTSMNQANNGSYYLNGVKAGSIYGQMGQTGISGGKHVDFGIYQTKNPYRLNIHSDTREKFESIFDFDSYNIKYQDDWVENFSGLPTKSIIDNYPAINKYLLNWTIRNIPNYSKVSYRG